MQEWFSAHSMTTPGCSYSKLFINANQGIEKTPTLKLCKKTTKTTKSDLTQNGHAK